MRLTLRTMLAYLDELLEPADRADIGAKLADSQFASQLVERIRSRLHNPRLGAPRVSGRGMGLDPNAVAEYLDNTLAAERVPDFEKMCLPPADAGDALVESDVYLAEVAACHQILAMVLGRPAHIDPQMKRRMYDVINQSPPPVPVGAANEEMRLEPEDVRPRPARQRPEIPEYLRDRGSRSSWKPILAAVILFALLVGAITMALGPLDQLLGLNNQPAKNGPDNNAGKDQPAAVQPADNGAAANQNPAIPNDGASGTADNAAGINGVQGAGNVAERHADPSGTPTKGTGDVSTLPMTDRMAPDAGSTAPAVASGNQSSGGGDATTVGSATPPPLPQPSTNPPAVANTTGPGPATTILNTPNADAAMTNAGVGPPAAKSANSGASPTPAPSSPLPPKPLDDSPLGRVIPGNGIVLLKFDAASSHWQRLPVGSALSAGDELLVLPTYRPTLSLTSGITLQIAPETLLTLGGIDASGVPGIKILYGRVVAITAGKAGVKLRIDVGANSGVVTFTDADAMLGVEVRRYFLAGVNPELEGPKIAADLYAASGHLDWTGQDGSTAMLTAPQRWPLTSPMPDAPAVDPNSPAAIPKWIAAEPVNAIYNRPAEALAAALDADKPLPIALHEMSNNRRVEFGAFAAQCLGLLDEFEPLIKTLNDPEQRPMWNLEIGTLKAALARGPSTATAVREAFEKQRGETGKDLYRMLLGYTKDQLQNGEAARLVENLDNDNLDFRVLAFTDLQEITKAHHNYRPEANDQSRKQPTRSWQEALRLGQIVPKEAAGRP